MNACHSVCEGGGGRVGACEDSELRRRDRPAPVCRSLPSVRRRRVDGWMRARVIECSGLQGRERFVVVV